MQTLSILAKCSDLFSATLSDDEKGQIGDYSGYVPKWFPSDRVMHFGDYVELDIDIKTGHILNWITPTNEQLAKTFKKQ